tara:strand:+ start:2655 stop:2930 length:276 start_codon:yes stop_codon:yes gene_type:complete
MILAKVTGSVVSTIKNKHLESEKLLITQPVDLKQNPAGESFLSLDRALAGEGDLVLVNKEGSGARLMYDNEEIPVQAVIVGVVDDIDVFIE